MDTLKNAVFTACLCAVLTSAVQIISPDKMRRELKLVCTLVLIVCIAAAVGGVNFNVGIADSFSESEGRYENYESSILSQTSDAIAEELSKALSDENIIAEKISIDCKIGEYNYVEATRAEIRLSDISDSERTLSIAQELLGDCKIEVYE